MGSDPLVYEPRRESPTPTANSRPSENTQCRLPTQPEGSEATPDLDHREGHLESQP